MSRTPALRVSSGHQMRCNLADCEYIEWHDCLMASHYWCVADIKEHLMQSRWEMLGAWHVSHHHLYTLAIHEDSMAADMVTVSVKEGGYWYLPCPSEF